MPNSMLESFKEVGRLALFAVVSWLITGGIDLLVNKVGAQLPVDMKTSLIALLVVVLRWLDKFLHESQKALPDKLQNEGFLGLKGLSAF